MRRIALMVSSMVVGCGGGGARVTPANQGGTQASAASPTPQQLCARVKTLHDEQCSPYDRIDPSVIADCSIIDGLYIASMQDCVMAPTCEATVACAREARANGAPYKGPTAPCVGAARPTIPAGVTAAELEASYGRGARRFSEAPTSKDRPIEVCGMVAEQKYVFGLTCDDGSKPFATGDDVARARLGNVGMAGRCGRIVDEYEVPCPEKTYQVFVDAYRCLAQP